MRLEKNLPVTICFLRRNSSQNRRKRPYVKRRGTKSERLSVARSISTEAEVDQTLATHLSARRQREMPRHQKQSSEAIMSFRMQNSSFRLAALGTFTFKCKLAECAPQSRLAVSSFPFWGQPPLSAPFYRPFLCFLYLSLSSSILLPAEDVGDMAEAPGFNILHLKCSARAREMQNSPTATLLFPSRSPPFLPFLPSPPPAFSLPPPRHSYPQRLPLSARIGFKTR